MSCAFISCYLRIDLSEAAAGNRFSRSLDLHSATGIRESSRTSLPIALRIARASFIDWQGLGLRKEVSSGRALTDFVGPLHRQHSKEPLNCQYFILEYLARARCAGPDAFDCIRVRTRLRRYLLRFGFGLDVAALFYLAYSGSKLKGVGRSEWFHVALGEASPHWSHRRKKRVPSSRGNAIAQVLLAVNAGVRKANSNQSESCSSRFPSGGTSLVSARGWPDAVRA